MARADWESWLQQVPDPVKDEPTDLYIERMETRERLHSLYLDMVEALVQDGHTGNNTWAMAAFAVWRAVPKPLRQPRHQRELALLLGFTSDKVFNKWLHQYPELFRQTSSGLQAMIQEYLPDVVYASIRSATRDGAQGFQDRKMLMTIAGMTTDKSERTIVGDAQRPVAVRNLDELSDEELAAIAMGQSQ